ncbi:MAG: Branched-chain-amino-acid aminotransferase [Alphaproteobacteria bacterium MarineAlpha9_Bin2]|nr:MAG: Branched-chain-amino-acid aminotransferase [Alphaproteobacteria bacterium MarineAlpha9_Bin2]
MEDFSKNDGFIWLDGKLIKWIDATVHVLTHGLHYASSVFEGERCYGGKIFREIEHTKRLLYSANTLGFKIPYSIDEICKVRKLVLSANKIKDGYIRPVSWRGSEMMGISAQRNKIHLAVAAWEWPSYYSPESKLKGIKLELSKWRRPSPDTAPVNTKAAGLYMICTLAKHVAEENGCQDALMLDHRGYIAETTSANIFMVINDEIHTPTPDCFLNGITRQEVIKIARKEGIPVIERHIKLDELSKADEVFVTGTAAEVTPVSQIGEYSFKPSKICKKMIEEYTKLTLE